MKILKRISFNLAVNIMMVFLSCIAVFHVLVLSGAVPYNIVWGGRLESESQMYIFETVSLFVNIAILTVIGMKANYIKSFLSDKAIKIILYGLAILFLLNTIGNMMSLNTVEAILFTPLTFISAALCYRIAIEK